MTRSQEQRDDGRAASDNLAGEDGFAAIERLFVRRASATLGGVDASESAAVSASQEPSRAPSSAPRRTRPTVAELIRFLTDPVFELPPGSQAALFADPQARADFQRLKSDLARRRLPMAAAAADEPATMETAAASDAAAVAPVTRAFDGGRLRLARARDRAQAYLVIAYEADAPDGSAEAPALLMLELDGEVRRRPLPAPDADKTGEREVMLIFDLTQEEDRRFVSLLADPRTTGAFLRARPGAQPRRS